MKFYNLPFFNFGPIFLVIKKFGILFGNQWNMANYKGRKKNIGKHPTQLWPLLKVPAEKLMPHSQTSS